MLGLFVRVGKDELVLNLCRPLGDLLGNSKRLARCSAHAGKATTSKCRWVLRTYLLTRDHVLEA